MKFKTITFLSIITTLFFAHQASCSNEEDIESVTFRLTKGSPEFVIANAIKSDQDRFLMLLNGVCSLSADVRAELIQDPQGISIAYTRLTNFGDSVRERNERALTLTQLGNMMSKNKKAKEVDVELTFEPGDLAIKKYIREKGGKALLVIATRALQASPILRGAILEDSNAVSDALNTYSEELQNFTRPVKEGNLNLVNNRAQYVEMLDKQEALKWYFVEYILSLGYRADTAGFICASKDLPYNGIQDALLAAANWIKMNISDTRPVNHMPDLSLKDAVPYLSKGDFNAFYAATDKLLETQPRVQFMHIFRYLGLSGDTVDIDQAYRLLKPAVEANLKMAVHFNSILKAVNSGDFSEVPALHTSFNSRQVALSQAINMLLKR